MSPLPSNYTELNSHGVYYFLLPLYLCMCIYSTDTPKVFQELILMHNNQLNIYWPISLATLHTVNRCPPMARNLSDSISISDRRPQPTDKKENRNWKKKSLQVISAFLIPLLTQEAATDDYSSDEYFELYFLRFKFHLHQQFLNATSGMNMFSF